MPPAQGRTSSRSGLPGGSAVRVHVVERDVSSGLAIAKALQARGMVARVVAGGEAALVEVLHDRPDVVVLSAELPDISGYAVCSRLKRDRLTAAIPVVITSDRPDSFKMHQKLWVRADAYLSKPFDAAGLAGILENMARRTTPPEEQPAQSPAPAPAAPAPSADDEEVLETGFFYLGGAAEEPEILEERFIAIVVEPAQPAEAAEAAPPAPVSAVAPLVPVATPAPIAAVRAVAAGGAIDENEVLVTGFVYLSGGPKPEPLEERVVTLVHHALAGASRTAPGRWKLPADLGVSTG